MKPINNAFINQKDYNCFACAPHNEYGLQMKFYKDGDSVFCKWNPKKQFDGWKGVVHGGIQACLIDEIGEWYIFSEIGRSAVTMNLDIRYKKPLNSNEGDITLKASLINYSKSIAEIDIKVYDNSSSLCTKAVGKFYVFSEKESKEKFDFPGKEKFNAG